MSHLPPKPDFDYPARYPVDQRQAVRSGPMALPPPERNYRERDRDRERDVYLPPPSRSPPRERDVYIASRPRPVDSYVAGSTHPPPPPSRDVYIASGYDRRDDDRYADRYRDRDYDRRDYPPPDYHRYRPRESSRERDWARDRDRDRERERDRDMMDRERHRRWDEDNRRGYDRDRRERSPFRDRERGWSRRDDDRRPGRDRGRVSPERTWIPRPSKSPPRLVGESEFPLHGNGESETSRCLIVGPRQPPTPGPRARTPVSPRRPRTPPSVQRSRPRSPPRAPSRGSPSKESASSVFKLGNHSIELSPRRTRESQRSDDGRDSHKRNRSRSNSPRRRSPMRLPPRRSPSPVGPPSRPAGTSPVKTEVRDAIDNSRTITEDHQEKVEQVKIEHPEHRNDSQSEPHIVLTEPQEVKQEDKSIKLEPERPHSAHSVHHPSPLPQGAIPIIKTRSPSPMQGIITQSGASMKDDTRSPSSEAHPQPATLPKIETHAPKPTIPLRPIPSMPSSMRRRRISRSPPTQPRNYVKTPTTPQSPQVQSPLQSLPARPEWTSRNSGLSAPSQHLEPHSVSPAPPPVPPEVLHHPLHVPLPAIPPFKTTKPSTKPLTELTDLEKLEFEVEKLTRSRLHLANEHPNIVTAKRRAMYELALSSIELAAAQKRRENADAQLAKAVNGLLGIDYVRSDSPSPPHSD
ncbi:hypothetical protein NLI96_g8435 [Meripilus lineatus]|uniref:Uncharacterized protein n=1 Tax=Meripilus lineatus TaxID=2056292 RepID=A0AAD5YB43_9APHY|nr:hypothetical protein NLI96_g8435 [Physisporinus lineatus]